MNLQRDVLPRAEGAADAGEHEPHLLLGESEAGRDLTQILVEPLRRDVERHAAVLPGYRESGLGPERGLVLHRDLVLALDDDVRPRVGVAVHDAHVLDDVAVLRIVELRSIGLQRGDRVGDGGKRLVLDLDRPRGETRLLRIVRRDDRDRFADVAHDARREHRLVGAHQAELLAGGQVVRREHRAHARHRARRRDIDTRDPRVRVRAAQRRSMEHALARQIAPVEELALHLRRRVRARRRFTDDTAQACLRRGDRHDV